MLIFGAEQRPKTFCKLVPQRGFEPLTHALRTIGPIIQQAAMRTSVVQPSTSEIELVQAGAALRSLASSVTSLTFICMANATKRAS
jgi:hypothetical protein